MCLVELDSGGTRTPPYVSSSSSSFVDDDWKDRWCQFKYDRMNKVLNLMGVSMTEDDFEELTAKVKSLRFDQRPSFLSMDKESFSGAVEAAADFLCFNRANLSQVSINSMYREIPALILREIMEMDALQELQLYGKTCAVPTFWTHLRSKHLKLLLVAHSGPLLLQEILCLSRGLEEQYELLELTLMNIEMSDSMLELLSPGIQICRKRGLQRLHLGCNRLSSSALPHLTEILNSKSSPGPVDLNLAYNKHLFAQVSSESIINFVKSLERGHLHALNLSSCYLGNGKATTFFSALEASTRLVELNLDFRPSLYHAVATTKKKRLDLDQGKWMESLPKLEALQILSLPSIPTISNKLQKALEGNTRICHLFLGGQISRKPFLSRNKMLHQCRQVLLTQSTASPVTTMSDTTTKVSQPFCASKKLLPLVLAQVGKHHGAAAVSMVLNMQNQWWSHSINTHQQDKVETKRTNCPIVTTNETQQQEPNDKDDFTASVQTAKRQKRLLCAHFA